MNEGTQIIVGVISAVIAAYVVSKLKMNGEPMGDIQSGRKVAI